MLEVSDHSQSRGTWTSCVDSCLSSYCSSPPDRMGAGIHMGLGAGASECWTPSFSCLRLGKKREEVGVCWMSITEIAAGVRGYQSPNCTWFWTCSPEVTSPWLILLSANALPAGLSCRPSADLPPHGQGGALLKAAFKCGQTELLRINSLVSPNALSAYFAFLLHWREGEMMLFGLFCDSVILFLPTKVHAVPFFGTGLQWGFWKQTDWVLKFGPVICFFISQNKQLLTLVFLFILNSPLDCQDRAFALVIPLKKAVIVLDYPM